MSDANLEISSKIITKERELFDKLHSVHELGMKISNAGVKLDDTSKRSEGMMILLLTSQSYRVSNLCGKYNNAFFIQSIIKDRSIDNDLLSDAINELVNMNKRDLIFNIDEIIETGLEMTSMHSVLSQDSREIILEYCQALRDFKFLVNGKSGQDFTTEDAKWI
jgi:hypothetical protein